MLRSELLTMFRRRRTIALLVVLAAVPVVITLAVKLSGSTPQPGEGPPFLDQVTHNGFFVALTALSVAISFLLPLTVSMVSGDSIAGEANLGTLRYVLLRPVSRLRLLVMKYLVSLVFALVATMVVVVAGMVAGGAFFGIGKVVTLSGVELSLTEGIGRAMLAGVVVASSMASVAAIGLFISTLTEQPMGATVATFVVTIVSQVLDAIPQLRSIHPALFSHYWLSFTDIFRVPMSTSAIEKGLVLQLAWAAVFTSAAWARLTTKDVLA